MDSPPRIASGLESAPSTLPTSFPPPPLFPLCRANAVAAMKRVDFPAEGLPTRPIVYHHLLPLPPPDDRSRHRAEGIPPRGRRPSARAAWRRRFPAPARCIPLSSRRSPVAGAPKRSDRTIAPIARSRRRHLRLPQNRPIPLRRCAATARRSRRRRRPRPPLSKNSLAACTTPIAQGMPNSPAIDPLTAGLARSLNSK